MRVHFDEHADAVHMRLDESAIVESEEVTPGLPLADLKEMRLRIA
jgi:hypothetical protein